MGECCACREQQALLLGAMQGLERHVMPMLAAWNRDALTSFTNRLFAAVEQGLEGINPMPQADTAAASSSSLAAAASGLSSACDKAAEHSPGAVSQELERPDACAEEGECAAGALPVTTSLAEGCQVLLEGAAAAAERAAAPPDMVQQQHVLPPKLTPPTPAGCEIRALQALPCLLAHHVMGTPVGSLREVQATPEPPARLAGSGGTQAPAHEGIPPFASFMGGPAAPQHTLDSLRAWAELQAPGDPAISLVLASAAHTAACDLGLAASVGPLPWPLYLIATRDSFTHHLHAHCTQARSSHLQCCRRVLLLRAVVLMMLHRMGSACNACHDGSVCR